MNLSVVNVVPWQQAMHSDFIVSFVTWKKIYPRPYDGDDRDDAVVLWIAFASLFAVVAGLFARAAYAAAVDGAFFPLFARLHPKKIFSLCLAVIHRRAGFSFLSAAEAGTSDQRHPGHADPGAVRRAGHRRGDPAQAQRNGRVAVQNVVVSFAGDPVGTGLVICVLLLPAMWPGSGCCLRRLGWLCFTPRGICGRGKIFDYNVNSIYPGIRAKFRSSINY